MEVSALFEGIDHGLAVGQMGEHSQLELSVIRNDKFLALFCDERLANFVDVLIECRLVLDVWFSAREAPRFGVDVYRAVDTAVAVDVPLQRLNESFEQGLDVSVLYQAFQSAAELAAELGIAFFVEMLECCTVFLALRVAGH